jgi:hypothetical protein
MSLEPKYKKSLTQQWSIRFETLHPDTDNYDGVITHNKPDFIVLREQEDFEFDGIVILSKQFIKSIRDGKYEKCCNEILRYNGAIKRLRVPKWMSNCETMQKIFNMAKRRNIWLGVEIVFKEGTESAFYIGPIASADEKHFSIKCYDATGKWEKEYQLDYAEVFKIEFASKYCNNFNAFMKSKSDLKS